MESVKSRPVSSRKSVLATLMAFLTLTAACAAHVVCAQSPAAAKVTPASQLSQAGDEDRRKKTLSDADQLVALAQKLKTSVDKSNKDTLSVSVVREAERLERLAHQMRDVTGR